MREHEQPVIREDRRPSVRVFVWSPGVIAGLMIAAFGVLLLLEQFDILGDVSATDFWPLLLVGLGLTMTGAGHGAGARIVGLLIIVLGVGFLFDNLTDFDFDVGRLWPLALILVGGSILWTSLTGRRHTRTLRGETSADVVHRFVTLGGAELKSDSQNFRGGQLSAVLGGIELDLRHASIREQEAVIDAFALMGGIEIRVPESWRVVCQVLPILGGFEDGTRPVPDEKEPSGQRLVIKGTAVMGGIEVKN